MTTKTYKGCLCSPDMYVPHAVQRLPTWLFPLPAGPAAPPLFNLTAFTSLQSEKLFKPANHILSQEPGVTCPLITTKPFLPQPLLAQSAPKRKLTLYPFLKKSR